MTTHTDPATRSARGRRTWLLGLAIALVCAGLLSFYASGSPDGLEFVAEQLGFAGSATEHAAANSPVADYAVAGIDNERMAGGLAGVAGTLIVLGLATGLAWLLRSRTASARSGGAHATAG